MLSHVAKTLHGGRRVGRSYAKLFQRFAEQKNNAVPGRFGTAARTSHPDGLSGDEAGIAAAMNDLELIQHPEHVLCIGHDIGSRYIANGADIARHRADPRPAEGFLLAQAEVVRRADDPALA